MQPLILFDFDGTLVDSTDLLVSVIDSVAEERGLDDAFRREGLAQYSVQKLIREMGVSFFKVPGFVEECRERFAQQAHTNALQPGVKQLIESVSEHAQLGVVSSNEQRNIDAVLEREAISELFAYVSCGAYFSKNKQIAKVREEAVVDKFFTLYVGDESRDVHAARRAGVDCLAVSWGVQGEQGLLKVRPRMLAHDPSEAERLIKAWIVSRGD